MSTYKRISGDYIIKTLNSSDTITLDTPNFAILGNVTITGSTSISGNLAVTKIFNGTSNVDVNAPNGPVSVGVNGSTIAVFNGSGLSVTGTTISTGNITGGNINTAGQVSATGNITGGNILGGANVNATTHTGTTVSVSANVTGGNINTAGKISATGSITGGTILTSGVTLNSDVSTTGAVIATGNITGGNLVTTGLVTITGNVIGGNLTTAGQVTATANIQGGNLRTAGLVSATGNITGGNLNFGTGNVTGTGNVIGGNVIYGSGIVSGTGNVYANNISLTGQANITGNLQAAYLFSDNNALLGNVLTPGYVSATGNVTGHGVFSIGNLSASGNVIAGVGSYLLGDGGFISNVQAAANVVATSIANGTTSIQVVNSGGNLLYYTANSVVLTQSTQQSDFGGNITATGYANITGNVIGGNIRTAGLVTATGNITGGNINFGTGNVTGTGNIIGGNVLFGAGIVSGTGNVTGGSGKFFGDAMTGTEGLYAGLLLGYSIVPSAVIQATTNTADYTQINQQNLNSGATVSADYVVTASDGTDTDNYIDVGLAGSNWDGTQTNSLTNALGPRDGYMYVQGGTNPGGNLVIGTASSGYVLKFIVGGNTSSNIKATLSTTGLSVAGNVTGSYFLGNGSQLTGIISSYGNANVVANLAALGSNPISTTGNITSGNLNAAGLSLSSNVVSALSLSSSLTAATTISAVGNITGGNLSGTSIAGTLTTAAQTNITSVGTLGSLGVTANITAGNLNAAGLSLSSNVVSALSLSSSLTAATTISAVGNITGGNILGGANVNATTHTGATVSVTGNVDAGNLRTGGLISATGAITGAALTGTSLTVSTGNITLGNVVNAGANGVGNIGSSTTYFNTIFGKATTAQYADLAENYVADQPYTAGTVVVFGGDNEVTADAQDADKRIAGVVSTNPAHLMNSGLTGANVVAVALTGRVPTSVVGRVRKGDTMVAAGNGAARAEADPKVATVIGKALENFDGESGIIEVVVGRV